MVLAHVLSGGYTQDIGGGCTHLKAWVGLEDSHLPWLTQTPGTLVPVVCRRPQFLAISHQRLSSLSSRCLSSGLLECLLGHKQARGRGRGRAWRKPQYPSSGSTPKGGTSKNVWTYLKTTTAYDIKYCLQPSVLCLGSESVCDPSDLFHFLPMNRRGLSESLVSTSLFPVATRFLFPCIRS